MRVLISLFLTLVLLVQIVLPVNAVSISAEKAIVYCINNQKIYYSKAENVKSKIASTTKIMTALLALEYAEKNNKKVEFTADMIAEGSSMYLKIGEVVTLRDLAVGLLLCSGNDAANATAIGISGSIENFARLMNKKAEKIGMKNTNFVNPSGLDNPEHYSTAFDMALLMSKAMENKEFAKITAMERATVEFSQPEDKIVTYTNHNRLLSMYDYCVGGKTGYTMASGRCLVTVAKKDELQLVCVTLNDRQDFSDHINLYEETFEKYMLCNFDDREFVADIKTENGRKDTTTVSCNQHTAVVIERKDYKKVKRKIKMKNSLNAPVKNHMKVGEIVYKFNGEVLAKHRIFTVEENKSRIIRIIDYIKEFFRYAFKNS